jgi:hypothetical protein
VCAISGSTDHVMRWSWTRPCHLPAAVYLRSAGQKLGYHYYESPARRSAAKLTKFGLAQFAARLFWRFGDQWPTAGQDLTAQIAIL